MTTNPLQLLTYFAGKTSRVDMGTFVVVAPWWDPLRLAEHIATLDQLLDGRRLSIGLGSGAAPREFRGFRVDRDDKRERGAEVIDIVRTALSQEGFSFEGKFFNIPKTSIRPRPRSKDITKNFFFAMSGPESAEYIGEAGLAPLYTTSSDWNVSGQHIDGLNEIRARRGWGPLRPVIVMQVYCSRHPDAKAIGLRHVANFIHTVVDHYEMLDNVFNRSRHFAKEVDAASRPPEVAKEEIAQSYAKVQVYGTPEECIEQILAIGSSARAGEFLFAFRYGSVTAAEAEASMRLFAAEVLPVIQAVDAPDRIEATPYSEVKKARANSAVGTPKT